jgi:hypothetical protein
MAESAPSLPSNPEVDGADMLGPDLGYDGQGVGLILKRSGAGQRRAGAPELLSVEGIRREEVEVARLPVPEVKRDGRPSVEHPP